MSIPLIKKEKIIMKASQGDNRTPRRLIHALFGIPISYPTPKGWG